MGGENPGLLLRTCPLQVGRIGHLCDNNPFPDLGEWPGGVCFFSCWCHAHGFRGRVSVCARGAACAHGSDDCFLNGWGRRRGYRRSDGRLGHGGTGGSPSGATTAPDAEAVGSSGAAGASNGAASGAAAGAAEGGAAAGGAAAGAATGGAALIVQAVADGASQAQQGISDMVETSAEGAHA